MENMVYISEEMPEEQPREAPPSYMATAAYETGGLHQLTALSRVDIRPNYVVTERGEVIFGYKRQYVDNTLYYELYDRREREVIMANVLKRCCSLEVHVNGPYGSVMTTLQKKKNSCRFFSCVPPSSPVYVVGDGDGSEVLKICTPSYNQFYFLLRLIDFQGNHIGSITKKWKGYAENAFADSQELQIDFPRHIEVQYKATIIAFCAHIVQEPNLIRNILYQHESSTHSTPL